MPLTKKQQNQLQEFFNQSQFDVRGAVMTDLDGTVIHEHKGAYTFPITVELGLKKIYELGRPVILNSLRFPLSVIRTFGKEWYKISNKAIPAVLMNGSQLGYIVQGENGEFNYEEIAAFPLEQKEMEEPLQIIDNFLKLGVLDLLVFYYPRNWKLGEIIWTPDKDKLPIVQNKYLSASMIYTSSMEKLKEDLTSQHICMVFLLIDLPQDKLMAYQHTSRSNIFTHKGVDKKSGAEQISQYIDFDLKHSIGAGDSEMDNFLKAVGLAVHVGNPSLTYEGMMPPVKVNDSSELGDLLFELATLQRNIIH